MKRAFLFGLAVLAAGAPTRASEPAAVFALVEKVVSEPSDGPAERIQVWGTFFLAKGGDSIDYGAPQRGYMYFTVVKDKPRVLMIAQNDQEGKELRDALNASDVQVELKPPSFIPPRPTQGCSSSSIAIASSAATLAPALSTCAPFTRMRRAMISDCAFDRVSHSPRSTRATSRRCFFIR